MYIHCTMSCILYMPVYIHVHVHVLMRDEKEGRKKEASKIKHVYICTCIARVVCLQSLEGLLEGMNPPPSDPELFVSFRDCHLLILKMIQVCPHRLSLTIQRSGKPVSLLNWRMVE